MKEKPEMQQGINITDSQNVTIIQAGRDVIKNEKPADESLRDESDSGIVLLFDVVGHSEQNSGDTICDEALNIFLSTIKDISSKHKFTWVKDIRDAGLFIGKDPKSAVSFYQEALKQFPVIEGRETKHRGFVIKFRLVSHFCPFKAVKNFQNQLIDIKGGEIDFLFKKMRKPTPVRWSSQKGSIKPIVKK